MDQELHRRGFIWTMGCAGAGLALAGGAVPVTRADRRPVTLAFAGCAHIHTPSFITLLNNREDVTVKWVWDPDPSRAQKRAPHVGARVAASPDEIWSDPEVTGVIICSETNRHRDLVRAAAQARKHLFVEKPLGVTARESFEMTEILEQAGLLFTTGYFMRTLPEHLFLRDEIGQGHFGKITRAQAWNCHNGSLGGWFDSEWRWMADPKQAGVGAFGDLGTHMLDILIWMLGDVAEVTADIQVVTGRYGDCDETGQALLRFQNGVTGTLAAGWVDIANPVSLMVSGTEGHAVIVNNQLFYQSRHVPGADGKAPWPKLPPKLNLPLAQFVEAVGGRKDLPLVTPREAAARVSVMEAMYTASRERRWTHPA